MTWADRYTGSYPYPLTCEALTSAVTADASNSSAGLSGTAADGAADGAGSTFFHTALPDARLRLQLAAPAADDTVLQYEVQAPPNTLPANLGPQRWTLLASTDGGATLQTVAEQALPSGTSWWSERSLTFTVTAPLAGATVYEFRFHAAQNASAASVAVGEVRLRKCPAADASPRSEPHVSVPSGRDGSFFVATSRPLLRPLYPTAGATKLRYRAAFAFRQDAHNSVENSRLPYMTITLALARGLNASDPSSPRYLNGLGNLDLHPLRRIPADGGAPAAAATTSVDFGPTNATADYAHFAVDFELDTLCESCTVVLAVDHDSWVSYWGNRHYISNVSLALLPADIPPRVYVQVQNAYALPNLPSYAPPANPRTACPHQAANLALWSDPATWTTNGNAVPAPGADVVLPANTRVLVTSCALYTSQPYGLIEVPASSTLVFDDADIELHAHTVLVRGSLEAGSPTCRLFSHIRIVLYGNQTEVVGAVLDQRTKGLVGHSGDIRLFGKEFHSWTLLATTAYPGDTHLVLQQAVNWEAGQKIVLVTTIWRDEDDNQNEVLTIKAVRVQPAGTLLPDLPVTVLELEERVAHRHYAGPEYQAEVGLLTRRITVEGSAADSNAAAGSLGGHILVTGSGRLQVAGVTARRMGQLNQLGRYPFHFHLLDNSPESFVRDCSIWGSFFRAVVIHGTNEANITNNVAFDITGSAFYFEDGVEERNRLNHNLAAFVHVIGQPAAGFGQPGELLFETAERIQPTDATAAGYYITNAAQAEIVGNRASGGWCGFAFPNLPRPILSHRYLGDLGDHNPLHRPLIRFDGNVAHSSGYMWNRGSCIYVGGRLETTSDGRLRYLSGRTERTTIYDNGERGRLEFDNTLVYLCRRGVNHWGQSSSFRGLEAHDIMRSANLFALATIERALVNGYSQNNVPLEPNTGREGFQFYDTWSATMLYNVTFMNYQASRGDNVFSGLTHSDTFKPQWISISENIHFVNVDRSIRVANRQLPTGGFLVVPFAFGVAIGYRGWGVDALWDLHTHKKKPPYENRVVVDVQLCGHGRERVGDRPTVHHRLAAELVECRRRLLPRLCRAGVGVRLPARPCHCASGH